MEQYGGSIERVQSTVTSGGTVTLVNNSPQIQVFTGSTTETVVLPNATSYTAPGAKFEFYNQSSGAIAVKYQDSTALQSIPALGTLIIKCVSNGTANGVWTTLSNSTRPSVLPPTMSIATTSTFSGGFSAAASGTYTTPSSPAPLYLKVRMIGGGGGGATSGSGSTGNGLPGNNTVFGTSFLVAGGANGGGCSAPYAGGGGGPYSITGLTTAFGINGANGTGGQNVVGTSAFPLGGVGGSSAFSGGGNCTEQNAGGVPSPNSGAGGGGGSGAAGTAGGGGGGAGGYIEAIITTLATTYAFVVGAGGAGGSGTLSGGNGGDGIIIVEEFYQ